MIEKRLLLSLLILMLAGCGGRNIAPDPAIVQAGDLIPVVIDTDMSRDDMMAILYLLAHPNVEVLAISVTGTGIVHCEPGVANALGLVTLSGQANIPVTCGRETPLTGDNAFPDGWRQEADQAFGLDLPPGEKAVPVSARELLAETIAETGEPVTIAALGPLTNIAGAIQETPGIISGIDRLYIMGGAVDVPGNVADGTGINNIIAEWNIYADPHAANIVFSAGMPITLVPLDGTNDVPVTNEIVAALQEFNNTPQAGLVLEILSSDAVDSFIDMGSFYFWDPLAVAVLTDEALATYEESPLVVIEEEGPENGRTLRAEDGPPIRVVISADRDRFEQLFLTVLNWPE
jgi:inosine-uridine nucleoside N-ribohydrolase